MKLTIARCTLELLAPLHIGSGLIDPETDAPVVRDAFGDYRIPGSSIAGALRAASHPEHTASWGCAGAENRASAIELSDGFLVDFSGVTTLSKRLAGEPVLFPTFSEIQDHVRIDHESGAALEGGKFDAEIVPQGTRFRCEIACIERASGANRESFDTAIAALASGVISFGGDVASGLGVVRILDGSLTVAEFDLSTAPGLTAARNRPSSIDKPAKDDAKPWTAPGSATRASHSSRECVSGSATLRFRADGPILVGGSQKPSNKSDADRNRGADLVFGESRVADYSRRALIAKPWIPGSSLRGAIRHRAWHIFEALSARDPEARIRALFGGVDGNDAQASRVRIGGQFLEQHERTIVQHVAIDRLTGGSLRGALYSEAPIWRDDLEIAVRIDLDRVALEDAAVLMHALIDMGTGSLPIGGGTRRGNGRLTFAPATNDGGFKGKAIVFSLDWNGTRLTERSPESELNHLGDALEAANQSLAGATS